ncbi:metal ABC transporter solute-binding protein, Zn/Mn family [Quadrisphaera oryzae]|uniref:metal ABC transporter solute-binding protein, Zn/Mn family n=1 Tax=Quadrisphaera TaxID=317661 RepID=UPI001C95E18B
MSFPLRPGAALVAGAALLALTGCGSSSTAAGAPTSSAGGSTASSGTLQVVASTDVWGDVAKSVGGDAVQVTSFISDPSQDPHSYEASARNQLAVKSAAVIVENGGGYDDFMEKLVSAAGSTAPVVNAVDVSGKATSAGDELNEHVWYDLPTTAKVAEAIAEQLGKADPAQAATFTANAKAFADGLAPLEAQEAQVASKAAGTKVGITEPVPDYLLEAMGLQVATPPAFSEAVEEGTDVSPAVLAQTEAQYTDKEVRALVYNEQTTGAETDAVKAAATAAGIPVVPVTETLPDGDTYTAWMSANISAIRTAVGL